MLKIISGDYNFNKIALVIIPTVEYSKHFFLNNHPEMYNFYFKYQTCYEWVLLFYKCQPRWTTTAMVLISLLKYFEYYFVF